MVQAQLSPFTRIFGAGAAIAPPQPPSWPMKIDDFVLQGHLQWSDIVLSRNEYNPLSWLIRYATKCNFAHASLVFLQPNWQHGWQSTYLIESVFSGVEVTDIQEYFKHPRLSVAVRRMNRDWFDDKVRRRVRGRMLDDIKAEYNFRMLIGLGRQFLFGLESAVRGHKRASIRRSQADKPTSNEFICSGFMQRGYAQGVQEFIESGKLPPTAFKEVIFDRNLAQMLPDTWDEFTPEEAREIIKDYVTTFDNELLAVTPRDLETHAGLEWAYVLSKGLAYKVSSYKDVCELLQIKPFPA